MFLQPKPKTETETESQQPKPKPIQNFLQPKPKTETETDSKFFCNRNRKLATETETDSFVYLANPLYIWLFENRNRKFLQPKPIERFFATETENRNQKWATETETDSKFFCNRNRKPLDTDSYIWDPVLQFFNIGDLKKSCEILWSHNLFLMIPKMLKNWTDRGLKWDPNLALAMRFTCWFFELWL